MEWLLEVIISAVPLGYDLITIRLWYMIKPEPRRYRMQYHHLRINRKIMFNCWLSQYVLIKQDNYCLFILNERKSDIWIMNIPKNPMMLPKMARNTFSGKWLANPNSFNIIWMMSVITMLEDPIVAVRDAPILRRPIE